MKKTFFIVFVIMILLSFSSCQIFELLFLPQDTSSELISATYIDETHFLLVGKGVEWNALTLKLRRYCKVYTSSDPNNTCEIKDVTNQGCNMNEYIITMDKQFKSGDTVYIFGNGIEVCGGVEFTVPGGTK